MRIVALACITIVVGCSSSSGDVARGGDAASDAAIETSSETSIADTMIDDVAPETITDTGAQPLDCKWAMDTSNCWRAFVAAVDECLGNVGGTEPHGSMSADLKSCAYPTSRSVTFAIAWDGVDERADRDFVIHNGTNACLHHVEQASEGGFTATSTPGTLVFTTVGNAVSLTCPDGTRYAGDATKIAMGCPEQILGGGVPGRTIQGASTFRFELVGSKDWDFICDATSSGDAGAD